MKRTTILFGVAALLLSGCHEPPTDAKVGDSGAATVPNRQSTTPGAGSPSANQSLAFIDDHPLALADLGPALLEDAGGEVLADQVLDVRLAKLMAEQGKAVSADAIEAERKILLESLSTKPDEAQTLLQAARDRRGLGQYRFQRLLARNAAMRTLVQPDVTVNDASLQLAFQRAYGARYQARIITVETLQEATNVVHKLHDGANFSDLAVQLSTDASRVQGGLLSPINADDPAYPDAVRKVLAKLEVHAVSNPVILEHGYAILKLEEKIAPQNVKFDDVKTELQMRVRRQVERMLMDRLVRTLVQEADVVITDPGLQQSWAKEKKLLLGEHRMESLAADERGWTLIRKTTRI